MAQFCFRARAMDKASFRFSIRFRSGVRFRFRLKVTVRF